jgi:copper chaperone CopZ
VVSVEVILVPEISCEACKTAIEGALTPLDGVSSAVVDVAAQRVRVEYDQARITASGLVAAIEEQGYEIASHGPTDQ